MRRNNCPLGRILSHLPQRKNVLKRQKSLCIDQHEFKEELYLCPQIKTWIQRMFPTDRLSRAKKKPTPLLQKKRNPQRDQGSPYYGRKVKKGNGAPYEYASGLKQKLQETGFYDVPAG
uniref:Uncharacterized protein n=1 Tax=Magallana gigas TaxID=29159 RepID=K1Q8K3_MAGGI